LQMFVVPVLSLYAYAIFFSGLTLYLMTAVSPFVALALFTPIGWRAVVHYVGICFSSVLFILLAPVVLGLFIDSAIVQPLVQAAQTMETTAADVNAALISGLGVDADGAITDPGAWYGPIVNGVTSGLVNVVADLAGLANGLLTGIGFVLMGLLFSILVAFGFEYALAKVTAGFMSGGGMSAGVGGFLAGLVAGGRGSRASVSSSGSSDSRPSIPVVTPSEVIYPPGNSMVPVSKRN
jgi:MFS family permease